MADGRGRASIVVAEAGVSAALLPVATGSRVWLTGAPSFPGKRRGEGRALMDEKLRRNLNSIGVSEEERKREV
jgi:hypothetical protein